MSSMLILLAFFTCWLMTSALNLHKITAVLSIAKVYFVSIPAYSNIFFTCNVVILFSAMCGAGYL